MQQVFNDRHSLNSCRRMFPLIQLILEGLDPNATYTLLLALRVKDPSRWRFLNGEWIGSESAIRGVTSEAGPGEGYVYVHPRSPLTGEEWMRESPVGFSKLKLSNKDSEGGKVGKRERTDSSDHSQCSTLSVLQDYTHRPHTAIVPITIMFFCRLSCHLFIDTNLWPTWLNCLHKQKRLLRLSRVKHQ